MPENMDQYQERLASLRVQMKKYNLDGFIVPRTDEFQGEFLAAYAERLAWLTGFTGSAGAAVILMDKAVVMSDGRYTIQLEQQVDGDLYQRMDSTTTSVGQWLCENAQDGLRLGFDEWLYTPTQLSRIMDEVEAKEFIFVPMDENLIDHIWESQPDRPQEPVNLFPDEIAGQSSLEKRNAIASELKNKGADACLLSVGDSICWLLNVRGRDIDFSPLMLSYALLYSDGTLDWFIGKHKVSTNVQEHLGVGIRVFDLSDMEERLSGFVGKVLLDDKTAPFWFIKMLESRGVEIMIDDDPCVYPKSIKSLSEQDAIREAHRRDGVAVTKFLKWLNENSGKTLMDELSVEEQLEAFRCEDADYLGASFSTIAGFNGNGAIVHYRATEKTNAKIDGDGLLLVDSGGQYRWGTTDITRTIAIGTPSQDMIDNYTRVLKGHLSVSMARFPKGTLGKDIDALAREPLRAVGLDYAHGTGHGVGCNLCVHEAASNLSPRGDKPLEAGMLLSNEPGYYKEGAYGIRIENLVLVQECDDDPEMLCFETVTLAPYDKRLINSAMLSESEKVWLDAYASQIK